MAWIDRLDKKIYGGKGRMNLQIGIFVALMIIDFFLIRIDSKLGRIIDLLEESENEEA